jgi:glucose/arabinose dehydrogenase
MRKLLLAAAVAVLVVAALPLETRAGLPAGFAQQSIPGPWDDPVGATFDDTGRMFVWEKAGRVWQVENGVKRATPLIDISDEVGNWRDHGLLGFALHPNFTQNGWIYLYYVVDHYYLQAGGLPGYDPNANDYFKPTIARITRYTARSSDNFHSVDPASRKVIYGESAGTSCALLYESHGVDTIAFGADDSLLVSCGDGGSYLAPDTGGPSTGAYTVQALAEGIITPKEDVGAYRAQLLSSHNGKLLRLDPLTGDGLPSNPFYDASNPRSARSRVFALGFRNPFRFTVRPGTGEHDPALADPGAIYLGNVGWNVWEEIEVVHQPGYNSGWPIYEAFDPEPDYQNAGIDPANQDAPNPLFGVGGCTQQFFTFRNLLAQDTLGTPSWPNPCNPAVQIPATIPRFVHKRAGLVYGHQASGPLRTPIFDGSTPSAIDVGAPGSPVSGIQIGGFAATGGVWYTGTDFPAQYQNSYFQADYVSQWILNIHYSATDQPQNVALFADSMGGVVSLATSPTGGLYVVDDFNNSVFKIVYAVGTDQPPVARASAAPNFGATPLNVQFNGSTSSDPEGGALSFLWNFGDGSPLSALVAPSHTFYAPVGLPTTYNVSLQVRDVGGQAATALVPIALNDTPPQVTITSPANQGLYGMTQSVVYPLTANISDAEQGAGQLSCSWQTTLHHNTHTHPEPVDTRCTTSAQVDPIGCDGNTFYFTFALTVSDGVGLSTTREVALYPDCASILPVICGNLDANSVRNQSDVNRLRGALANPIQGALTAGELARCSTIGDTACDVADLTVLRRYLAGKAPGPMPVCPAAQP